MGAHHEGITIQRVNLLTLNTSVTLVLFTASVLVTSCISYFKMKRYDTILSETGLELLSQQGLAISILSVGVITSIILCISTFLHCFGLIGASLAFSILLGSFSLYRGGVTRFRIREMMADNYYFGNLFLKTPNMTHNLESLLALSALQSDLNCCGLQHGKEQFKKERVPIPPSCCKVPLEYTCDHREIYAINCVEAFEKFVLSLVSRMAVFLWGFGFLLWMNFVISIITTAGIKHFFYY